MRITADLVSGLRAAAKAKPVGVGYPSAIMEEAASAIEALEAAAREAEQALTDARISLSLGIRLTRGARVERNVQISKALHALRLTLPEQP